MNSLEPYPLEMDFVEEKAAELGKTNTQYNIYYAALKMCEEYRDAGLTPAVYYDPLSLRIMVTSEEYVSYKFH